MDKKPKNPPAYAIASVDHALRLATMLQIEGPLSVVQAAARLGVARSTAHRLLQMLVYRDFAVQDDLRVYHAGPVLELATHSRSGVSRLRAAALPQLQRLTEVLQESANLTIRTGDTVRFVASVECTQPLRVGSREGMAFPAHRTTAGLLLLAELSPAELRELYAVERDPDAGERVDMARLEAVLRRVRKSGFALNQERSERGVVAVGVAVRASDGRVLAGLSVSMPSVRYDARALPSLVATLTSSAREIERDLGR